MKQSTPNSRGEKSLTDNKDSELIDQEVITSIQSTDSKEHRSGVRYMRARLLDSSKLTSGASWKEALEHVYTLTETNLGKISPQRKSKFRKTLETIVANLIVAFEADNSLYISFNLGKKPNQNLPHEIKRDIIRTFEELGYIELAPGYRYDNSRARRSRMRATPQLQQIIDSHGASHWKVTRPYEPLTLKGKRRRPIQFRQSRATRKISETIQKLNDNLWEANPHLQLPPGIPFPTFKHKNGLRIPYDQSRNKLKRTFNRASFKSGGRFSGHWLQRVPSIYRQFITLGGMETVELDYGGLHFAIMYALKGIQMKNDPYFVPGFDTRDRRKLCKIVANIMINAGSHRNAFLGALSKARMAELNFSIDNVKAIMKHLEKAHHQLKGFFYSDKGVELMYHESQMAEEIMLSLAADGIPCLPVHDSFVVPKHTEKQLKLAMITAFKNRFGFSPTIKPKERVKEADIIVVNGQLKTR